MNNTKEFTPHPSIPTQFHPNMINGGETWEQAREYLHLWASDMTTFRCVTEVLVNDCMKNETMIISEILAKFQKIVFDKKHKHANVILSSDHSVTLYSMDKLEHSEYIEVSCDHKEISLDINGLEFDQTFTPLEVKMLIEKWLT